MPLAVGVTTVLGTFLVLSLVNRVYGLSVFALNLVIGLGLGLAIDYTLFLVTPLPRGAGRARRDAGRDRAPRWRPPAAPWRSRPRPSSAALITLVVFPQGFLKSMGIAGAIVAVVAALAALVIAPALFALWGAKLAAAAATPPTAARWHRLAHAVMRRARIVAPLTALAMLALSLPALTATWSAIDSSVIPEGKSARTVADAVNRGEAAKSPMAIAVSAPAGARAEVQAFADRVARRGGRRARRAAARPRLGHLAGERDRRAATRRARRPRTPSRRSARSRRRSTCASAAAPRSSSTSRRRSARGCCSRSRCSSA